VRLGAYDLLADLGQGSQGAVFRARAPDGAVVALKVLTRTTPQGRARFERERRLLATLGESAGFVPLLDAGEAQGSPFVVMPFLAGGTLRERLKRRGRLELEDATALGKALATAIGRAHAVGVIHRDLKPENILFTKDGSATGDWGKALIADLGLAKHFDRTLPGASQSMAITHAAAGGTPGYMAPEQIVDPSVVGPASDVFALAVIIYECLAGHSPFGSDSTTETLARTARGSTTRLGTTRRGVSHALELAVARGLAPRPQDRYPDGVAFARALAFADESSGAMRFWLAAVAALLVVMAASVALVLNLHGTPAPLPSAPLPPAAVAPAPRSTQAAPSPKPAPPEPRPKTEAELILDRASERYLDHQDVPGSKALVEQALALDPKLARGWAMSSVIKMCYRDNVGAIADATTAVELDPKCTEGWTARVKARELSNDLKGALEDAIRATEVDPRSVQLWTNRANIHFQLDDPASANEDFTHAIALDPANGYLYGQRAIVRNKVGDKAGVVEDYRRLLELAPDSPDAPAVRDWLEKNAPPR
jgi:serine/threonine protein kinase